MRTSDYYKKYKNLYSDRITAEHVAGARPMPEWLILERVEAPRPEDLPSTSKKPGIKELDTLKKRDPMVFHVLAVGTQCHAIKVGELVSITYLAGDQFANSSILVCNIADVTFVWREGLELPSGY